jgi:hypothetical protein
MQKKKKYIVAAAFWKDGLLVPVGQEVWLFPSEAKYRGNALTDPDKVQLAAPVDETEADPKPVRSKRVKAEVGADNGDAE